MKVAYKDSIKHKVEDRIHRMRFRVILRDDLADIGEYRQISRALNKLILEQKLAKIGKGVYAKMRPSVITGEPVLDGAFIVVAREALNRLGVSWEPETAEQQYNLGKSMQVPASGRVQLKSRFSRKIEWDGMVLQYERASR